MKTIELPDDTYARLQRNAEPLTDRAADVIERALDALEAKESNDSPNRITIVGETTFIPLRPGAKRDLVNHVGCVPHGTKLRAMYKGREYLAEVYDGSVIWNGQHFPHLSPAAVAVIQSTGSTRPTEDGWRFWQYYNETNGEWENLSVFRAA